MAAAGVTGGDKFEAALAAIAAKLSKPGVLKVGFFETEKYPDGTFVAQVAFWNEFGTKRAPVRPFFRQMIAANSGAWAEALAGFLRQTKYDQAKALALLGELINDQLVNSIRNFTTPANAPSTIAAKGFNKPLTDTEQMSRSSGYRVEA